MCLTCLFPLSIHKMMEGPPLGYCIPWAVLTPLSICSRQSSLVGVEVHYCYCGVPIHSLQVLSLSRNNTCLFSVARSGPYLLLFWPLSFSVPSVILYISLFSPFFMRSLPDVLVIRLLSTSPFVQSCTKGVSLFVICMFSTLHRRIFWSKSVFFLPSVHSLKHTTGTWSLEPPRWPTSKRNLSNGGRHRTSLMVPSGRLSIHLSELWSVSNITRMLLK